MSENGIAISLPEALNDLPGQLRGIVERVGFLHPLPLLHPVGRPRVRRPPAAAQAGPGMGSVPFFPGPGKGDAAGDIFLDFSFAVH